jgi:hypothetical protein
VVNVMALVTGASAIFFGIRLLNTWLRHGGASGASHLHTSPDLGSCRGRDPRRGLGHHPSCRRPRSPVRWTAVVLLVTAGGRRSPQDLAHPLTCSTRRSVYASDLGPVVRQRSSHEFLVCPVGSQRGVQSQKRVPCRQAVSITDPRNPSGRGHDWCQVATGRGSVG